MKLKELLAEMTYEDDESEEDYLDGLMNKLSINMPDGAELDDVSVQGKLLVGTGIDENGRELYVEVPLTGKMATDFSALKDAFEEETRP